VISRFVIFREGLVLENPEDAVQSSVLNLIRKRYSCRRYAPRAIVREDILLLKEAVRWAPSACNRQPYVIHFITDPDLIGRIARAVPIGPASPNAWITSAPMIIAAVGTRELVWHRAARVVDADYHRTDAVIAMDHLSLVATEAGLGTCWVGWFHRRKVARLLGLRRGEEVVILMTAGYPDRDPPKNRRRKESGELFVER
jgi:nitroreductase